MNTTKNFTINIELKVSLHSPQKKFGIGIIFLYMY